MSQLQDIYKYYCVTEAKFISESVDIDADTPDVCKNNNAHTVDWSTLTLDYLAPRKEEMGLTNVTDIKDNLTATVPPSVDDDSTVGYMPGSRWIDNATSEAYVCLSASIGAAVWDKLTEAVNASNIGTSGVGVFKDKLNEILRFKKINAGSNKLSIVNDAVNNKVDIDVVENSLNIDNLLGAPNGDVVGTSDHQTLTNKTIGGDNNLISIDASDVVSGTFADERISVSSVVQHEGGLSIGNLVGAPDGDVVGTTDYQTLTNKTLVDPKISTIINTGTLTLPTSADTLVGQNTVDTLTNKTWGDDLDMNSNKITNLGLPIDDGDAASKSYVDGVASGLDVKDSVVVASTGDLSANTSTVGSASYDATGGSGRGQLTGILTVPNSFVVDGISFGLGQNGSRILLKNQENADQNGIWIVTVSGTSLTLDRAVDFDQDAEVTSGAFMFVEEGGINANSGWILTTKDPITIGGVSGSDLVFAQFSGAGQIVAGSGMTKTGNTLNVVGSNTVLANNDNLEVNSSNTVGQILLSSGIVGIGATFGALPLGNSAAVKGILSVKHGGSGAGSFPTGNFVQGNGSSALTAIKTVPQGVVVGTTDTQTLINKTIDTNNNSIVIAASDVKSGQFNNARISANSVVQHEGLLTLGNLIGAPSSTVVGVSDVQTLTNKTLTSPKINDVTGDHSYVFAVNELVDDRVVTLPALDDDDTFVFMDHTQTLTNKTIDTADNTIVVVAEDVVSGVFADERISASSVVQHEKLINHNKLNGYVINEHLDWTLNQTGVKIHRQNIGADAITQYVGSLMINKLSGAPIGTVVGTTDVQALRNKTIDTAFNVLTIAAKDVNDGVFADARIKASNVTQHEGKITIGNLIGAPLGAVVGTTDAQTLANKTLDDVNTLLRNNDDHSKKLKFDLANITPKTTRTLSVPDANTTLVGTNTIQTLTNKTINSSSNSITIRANNVIGGTFANGVIAPSNVTQHAGLININSLLNAPKTTVVGVADVQTFTHKTINSADNNVSIDADSVKSGVFHNSRISASSVTQHQTAINHDMLMGYVKNKHIDHSKVSIDVGVGLAGGGTITTSRTINLDINNLPEDPTPNSKNDFVVTYDASANSHKKVRLNLVGGSSSTAINVGTVGVGIFKRKDDTTLEFKKINARSNKLTVVDDSDNDKIDINVVEANINHDHLYGFVGDEHVNHSMVGIEVGAGLVGGGDLTKTRTIDIDINGLSVDSNPSNDDFVMTYDRSVGGLKKVSLKKLLSQGGVNTLSDLTDVDLTAANKGDLLVNDGTDWIDLGVGANGQVLTVDSSQVLGVKWTNVTGAQRAFSGYDSVGGLDVVGGVIVNINKVTKNTGHFKLVDGVVTVNDNGLYQVSFEVSTEIVDGNGGQSDSYCWLELEKDVGSGYVEVAGTRAWMYNRTLGNSAQTGSRVVVMDLKAGHKLRLKVDRYSGSDTIATIANGSSLSIVAVGGNGKDGVDGKNGAKGAQGLVGPVGPAGSGSTVHVFNNGNIVSGSPFSVVNYLGGVSIQQNADHDNRVDIDLGPTWYGALEVNPVATPKSGDRYYNTALNQEMFYDGWRKKWLSVAIFTETSGSNGNTSAGSFYKRHGMSLSHTRGPFVPTGTIVAIGFGTDNATMHTYEILVGGMVIAKLSSGGAAEAYSDTFNVNFAGGKMSSRNAVGSGTTSYFQGTVWFRLRV